MSDCDIAATGAAMTMNEAFLGAPAVDLSDSHESPWDAAAIEGLWQQGIRELRGEALVPLDCSDIAVALEAAVNGDGTGPRLDIKEWVVEAVDPKNGTALLRWAADLRLA